MDKFIEWFRQNQYEIGWFLIGWMTMAGLQSLHRGDGIGALLDFGLAYLNYRLIKG